MVLCENMGEPLTKDQVLSKISNDESFDGYVIGDVDFSGHVFNQGVNFTNAKFMGLTNFEEVTFSKWVNFDYVQFGTETNFWRTKFADVRFSEVIFLGNVNFQEATFKSQPYFVDCKFEKEVNFKWVYFHCGARFARSQFNDYTVFQGSQERKIFSEKESSEFSNVIFENPKQVVFLSANLGKCHFVNTNVEQVDFTDVNWGSKWELLGRRLVLCDESSIRKELREWKRDRMISIQMVEKVYRQLKINYENRGSYGMGGEFHFGEMEMRRLALGRWQEDNVVLWYLLYPFGWIRRNILSLFALYKYFSGYGERYWLASCWLVLFVFILFPLLYVKLNLTDSFLTALLHSLDISTFQKTAKLDQLSTEHLMIKLVVSSQRILVTSQLALFLLAIRRKFKR